MKLTKSILSALGMGLVCFNAQAGVKVIGEKNGVVFVRVKSMGIFCPSTTGIYTYPTNQAGKMDLQQSAAGAGVLEQVAMPGAMVGGSAVRRPSKTEVKQAASAETFSQGGEAIVTTGNGNGNGGNNSNGGNGGGNGNK